MAALLFHRRYSPTLFKVPFQVRRFSLAYNLHEPRSHAEVEDAPIVIMHGLFGSKQNNRSISKVLARDLDTKVYAIDLRNHGHSPHDKIHDYTSMASDVEGFISEHRLERPVLIGHSMGAKVAMTLALSRPELVSALVSVDNAPVDAVLRSDFAKYVQGMKRIVEARVTKQTEADKILKLYEEALPIRQFLLTNLVRNADNNLLEFRVPLHTLAMSLDKMGDFPFKDPEMNRYDGPTLIVRGVKSHYVLDEMIPLIGRFFPRFQMRDIDSGHWVISEQPEAFRQAIVEFLASKE